MTKTAEIQQARVHFGVLILLCGFLFFFGLGNSRLWEIDEGKHATTSKEMVQSGDWVTPTFNGEPFFDKPPLYNWVAAVFFLLFGFAEWAARLPAAIFGLGGVLVTYGFGRRLLGPRAAFLGALVLATAAEYLFLSRAVVHDISLMFFVTLSLFSFYRAYDEGRSRLWYLVLCYVSIGFAVLAKGPVGLLLPGTVVLIFLLLRRDIRFVLEMRLWLAVVLVAAVALPWYAAVARQNESYLGYFLVQKNLGHFLSEEARHNEPLFYYLPVIVLTFLPWSFYLPQAIVRFVKRPRAMAPGRLLIAVWFFFILLFFSAAQSKLPTYILPLFPPGALILGSLWADLIQSRDPGLKRGVLVSTAISAAGALVILFFLYPRLTADPVVAPEVPAWGFSVIAAGMMSCVLLAAFFVLRGRYRSLMATLVGAMIAVILGLTVIVLPALDPYKSSQAIALEYDRLLEPDEKMTMYRRVKETALFYTDRQAVVLRSPQELEQHLSQAGALCLIDTKWFRRIDDSERILGYARVVARHANKVILEGRGP